ncbi:indoleamine 2,3-dioxygenase [Erythrobacter sp. EC-HK427]|uniref:indoleamine 2,3-dioxygenase n=1 Tax=Erythrobacter sp. EC-HK427 TaxID=2038396 RepID=UPI001257B0DD|nr:indoleamine 2,3-dioxygenase [Erythrobacter sp. EC-HK427]VVT06997.1 Indoleamine 2,3-dioxygenase [Erythrobacter sp. EC-HK427]
MNTATIDKSAIKPLADYDMSAETGFLCRHDAAGVTLPDAWADAAKVALQLPNVLPAGEVRAFLEKHLPAPEELSDAAHLSDAQARMATVHYTFMVQSWVWGEQAVSNRLPAKLAVPMVALADRLGQQPLLTYSSYVLDNWSLIDPAKPVALDNIRMIQNFLGGMDEAWFVLVHVAIEACAGEVLARFAEIDAAVKTGDAELARTHLEANAERWAQINALFDRMPERCDPYIYFERVRPYIHGWKDNPALPEGVIYEGVERYGTAAQAFRGQTGSQSSIVPSMDALMGVGHAADPLREYLDQLHEYRPGPHRRFVDDVRAASTLRGFAKEVGSKGLNEAYNANIQAVADFRTRHLEYAASYINKQGRSSAGNDTDVGTGGTPFMRYLKKHRDETATNLL